MSGITVAVPPTCEPISLAEAREFLRVDGTDQDGLIAGHTVAARQYCEKLCGRAFINRTLDAKFDYGWPCGNGNDANEIELRYPPLVSVTSITYVDGNGATQTLASNQYRVSLGDIAGIIVPEWGVSWPAVRSQVDAITVRFVTGYGTNLGDVPEPIRQAVMLYTRFLYDSREEDEAAAHRLLSLYRTEFL